MIWDSELCREIEKLVPGLGNGLLINDALKLILKELKRLNDIPRSESE